MVVGGWGETKEGGHDFADEETEFEFTGGVGGVGDGFGVGGEGGGHFTTGTEVYVVHGCEWFGVELGVGDHHGTAVGSGVQSDK